MVYDHPNIKRFLFDVFNQIIIFYHIVIFIHIKDINYTGYVYQHYVTCTLCNFLYVLMMYLLHYANIYTMMLIINHASYLTTLIIIVYIIDEFNYSVFNLNDSIFNTLFVVISIKCRKFHTILFQKNDDKFFLIAFGMNR